MNQYPNCSPNDIKEDKVIRRAVSTDCPRKTVSTVHFTFGVILVILSCELQSGSCQILLFPISFAQNVNNAIKKFCSEICTKGLQNNKRSRINTLQTLSDSRPTQKSEVQRTLTLSAKLPPSQLLEESSLQLENHW